MRPRRAIGVSDMGCNKIEPDSIEDGIVKSVNQRKRATTPEGRMIIGLGYTENYVIHSWNHAENFTQ